MRVAVPCPARDSSYRGVVTTTEPDRAWCLVNGVWAEREDPVMAVCDPCGGDVGAAMTGLGYEAWCQVGVGDLPWVPVSLALYSREAPPLQFLLQLEGNAGNIVEHVFAETLPDAMELLARWAPIARTPARAGPYDPTVRAGDGRVEDGRARNGDVTPAKDAYARDRARRAAQLPGDLGGGRDHTSPDGCRAAVRRPDRSGSPAAVERVVPPDR